MSKYRVDLQDVVDVKVKFKLQDKGTKRNFEWTMTATRLDQDTIDSELADNNHDIKALLKRVMTNWSGQRLVLENDQPADFCAEAFDAMLGVTGVPVQLYTDYLKAIAPSKN